VVAWRLLRPQTPGLAPLSTPAPASLPEEPVSTAPPPSEGPVAEASAPPSSAPALSRLTLTSEPQGARVLVGRRVQGVTPLDLQLPPGPASLVVEKAGFRPWRRSLQLAPGGEVSLNAVLEAEPMPERSPPSVAPPPPPSTAPKAAATKEGDLVALTPDVTPPKRLSGDAPVVSRSFSVRASTAVVIEFLVTEDGVVQDAKVVESGGAVLDKACLDALSKWRYAPATKEGVKVRVGQRARFVFQRR
jgi:TonB family protein